MKARPAGLINHSIAWPRYRRTEASLIQDKGPCAGLAKRSFWKDDIDNCLMDVVGRSGERVA
jgi:hypothetical protein